MIDQPGAIPHEPFVLVAGLRSNLRGTLVDAIQVGKLYGYQVQILDVSHLVEGWSKYPNEWDELGLGQYVTTPRHLRQLSVFFDRVIHTSTPVLFLFLPERRARKIWHAIERKSRLVGVITVGPVPGYHENGTLPVHKKIQHLLTMARTMVLSAIKPSPSFWVVAGRSCADLYRWYFRSVRKTNWIWAHSLDYELYRQASEQCPRDYHDGTAPEKYIVFLDQGWFSKLPVNAVDLRTTGGGRYPPVAYESYQTQIVKFLRELGTLTKKEVIVCAHPKSDDKHTQMLYEGFRIERGRSSEFVRDSAFVVAHSSTSIQYAVIERKPVLLFTNRELDDSIMRAPFLGYKNELNLPVVDIGASGSIEPIIADLKADRVAYERFEEGYIKSQQSEQGGLWDIVFDQVDRSI